LRNIQSNVLFTSSGKYKQVCQWFFVISVHMTSDDGPLL